ncbi:MAG: ribosomal RNA small subunit methyltransferase H [bacterium]|nr:MAG: ribosomal RNA small subunit methyltransferase H [bacterium]
MIDFELQTNDGTKFTHIPVMPDIVASFSEIAGKYIDLTVGMAGHSKIILKSNEKNFLLGVDCNKKSLTAADEALAQEGFSGRYKLVYGNFRDIGLIAAQNDFIPAEGILADLGFSSVEIAEPIGLSFDADQPLDMRLDSSYPINASEIVNRWSESKIFKMLQMVDERKAGAISHAICRRRQKMPITRTVQLAQIVSSCFHKWQRIHPATKTFLALRIVVNREIENLETMIHAAFKLLKIDGRLAVISFNSIEDRIVKRAFKEFAEAKIAILPYKKGVVPNEKEKMDNPRSRSARLRIMKRIKEE